MIVNADNSCATMLATRVPKPKLTLSISTATSATSRPVLTIQPPMTINVPRTPLSPPPLSPTAHNTRLNQRGFSTMQQPTFAYTNASSSKSILKKTPSRTGQVKRIRFSGEPTVHCITPIENTDDYYGTSARMSRDERRWGRRS